MIKSLTSLVILLSFNFIVSGCALFVSEPEEFITGPMSKSYPYAYDVVWRALQKSISAYPLVTNNMELGVIETEPVRGKDRFFPPHKGNLPQPNFVYQLDVKVLRGKIRGEESARVSIEKNITFEKDFFSGEKKLMSDGFEEKMLFYRIDRELLLDHSLQKAFKPQ